MRHRKKFNHLGRTSAHRKAMLSNMATSLILHKRIKTTLAKAKALRLFVEPIITKSKDDSTHSRRVVFSMLKSKFAVSELFREISPKVADRPGGYTRIIKTGFRQGDAAEMCIIELVDFNLNLLDSKGGKKATKGRSRRAGRKKSGDSAPTAKVEAPVASAPAVEEASVENVTPVAEVSSETPEVSNTPEQENETTSENESKKE